MAGQKAKIDKDSSDYLSKTAQPEAERETAYHSQDEIEGDIEHADRAGNDQDVYSGGTKKDKTRKADRHASGTTGIGDTASGLDKMESTSPFASVLRRRFGGIQEAENPGQASAAATSDNPSLGMVAINNTDFRPAKADIRGVLESIALQAAESFEALDENSTVPDSLSNELQNTAKAVAKLYEYINKSKTTDDGSVENSEGSPVAKDSAERKPGVNEETEELDEKLIGKQHKIDKNHNGKLDAQDFKLLRSKKTMKEAVNIVFAEMLKGKFDADY